MVSFERIFGAFEQKAKTNYCANPRKKNDTIESLRKVSSDTNMNDCMSCDTKMNDCMMKTTRDVESSTKCPLSFSEFNTEKGTKDRSDRYSIVFKTIIKNQYLRAHLHYFSCEIMGQEGIIFFWCRRR